MWRSSRRCRRWGTSASRGAEHVGVGRARSKTTAMNRPVAARIAHPFSSSTAARPRPAAGRSSRRPDPSRRWRPLAAVAAAAAGVRAIVASIMRRRGLRRALLAIVICVPLLAGGYLLVRRSPLSTVDHVRRQRCPRQPGPGDRSGARGGRPPHEHARRQRRRPAGSGLQLPGRGRRQRPAELSPLASHRRLRAAPGRVGERRRRGHGRRGRRRRARHRPAQLLTAQHRRRLSVLTRPRDAAQGCSRP